MIEGVVGYVTLTGGEFSLSACFPGGMAHGQGDSSIEDCATENFVTRRTKGFGCSVKTGLYAGA